jgi:hypothetical protein
MKPQTMQDAVDEAGRKARRQNAADIVADLDKISRERALTDAESRRLAGAIALADRPGDRRRYYWSEEMDRQMLELRERKVSFPTIARTLGVTLKAAEMRVWRIRRMEASSGN